MQLPQSLGSGDLLCLDTIGHSCHLLRRLHLAGASIELDAALGHARVSPSRWQSAQVNVPVVQAHSYPQTSMPSVPSNAFRWD